MCWQCDHPDATLGDYLDTVRAKIDKNGWGVQYIESDRRPFAYTIGLHGRGLAELLITGVSPQRALLVLNTVADYCVNTVQPSPGEAMTLPDCVIEFVHVTRPDVHLAYAINIYGAKLRALQLVWVDDRGHSPWCPNFDEGRGSQPVLGSRAVRRPG
jgi:hypothetical protein